MAFLDEPSRVPGLLVLMCSSRDTASSRPRWSPSEIRRGCWPALRTLVQEGSETQVQPSTTPASDFYSKIGTKRTSVQLPHVFTFAVYARGPCRYRHIASRVEASSHRSPCRVPAWSAKSLDSETRGQRGSTPRQV